ncbi:MAG: class I SAM-dependent methyltransferase [Anaerotruncus sp.]|nr:class I SAM-dependent methyltransferase [Anaerotruncus sp.]
MAYGAAFAAYYDRLTGEIDYPARARYFDRLIRQRLAVNRQTILLDLACGTGSLTCELARLGYDMIGVDGSSEMLSEALAKKQKERVLFLCQPMEQLDLYGTIDAAVCALDSLNHITSPQVLEQVFQRVSLFTVPGGVFVFDTNTPYKHRELLGNHTYVYDLEDVYCVWQNTTDEALRTEITLDFFVRDEDVYYREEEQFFEQCYTQTQLEEILKRTGFALEAVYAGDTERPLEQQDQRAVYVARKL